MKKSLLITLAALFALSSLFGLEVDEEEIKSTSTTIEFINYNGPHKVIDSISAIKGIGSGMGIVISKDLSQNASTGNKAKYYVVHAVDNNSGKLDADIIFIGSDATVDHINNLRRIISAYLSSAYGYSEKDADTLAVFVTVYNAVYRSNLDYFKTKYKDIVINNLSASDCGLSVNYKDWPGHSEIVIPLFNVTDGGLSTVDTSVISDTKVVESMKEDDDKNIESRKDMVDLKEREAEDASEKAKEAQKQATVEQKKLDEEKEKTEELKKEAEEKKEIAEKNPEDKAAQQEAKEAEEKLEEQEKKEEEQAVKTEEARQEASEQQAIADKKQTEAQSERKEIAKDQQEVQKAQAEAEKMPSDYGIIISNESSLLSRLVKFNSDTGVVIKNSPITEIRSRTIYKGSTNFIAIAGEEGSNTAIKLVTIDVETMEINGESNENIAANSVLVKEGDDYYCVINKDGEYTVGKFDENLTLKLNSSVQVMSATPITVTDSGIVVTGTNGKLLLLDLKDLSPISPASSTVDAK